MMFHTTTKSQARIYHLVESYLVNNAIQMSTQQVLDSGAIPALKGYKVKPGKVSDSIFGGSFTVYENGVATEIENPPLQSSNGLPLRIMVRTSRISTHDIVRGEIPYKDQVLALNHNFMSKLLVNALGSAQIDMGLADNCVVSVQENLKQIPFENVLRAYMAKTTTDTSLYHQYMRGMREYCGHVLPDNLIVNGPLPYVMDTPTTKSVTHDRPISPCELIEKEICTSEQYIQIRNSSIYAFGIVTEYLRNRGIIAVDTKTEHGINQAGKIVCQDEIWTLDSSRLWQLADYQQQYQQLQAGKIEVLNPKSFSKEFAREIVNNGKKFSDQQIKTIAIKYIEIIEYLLQKPFMPNTKPRDEQVIDALRKVTTILL